MKYPDGQEVFIGDRVSFSDGSMGEVVFCIDRNEFTTEYPKSEWEYLALGAMVKSEKFGLIHYTETDGELSLVARRGTQNPPLFEENGS